MARRTVPHRPPASRGCPLWLLGRPSTAPSCPSGSVGRSRPQVAVAMAVLVCLVALLPVLVTAQDAESTESTSGQQQSAAGNGTSFLSDHLPQRVSTAAPDLLPTLDVPPSSSSGSSRFLLETTTNVDSSAPTGTVTSTMGATSHLLSTESNYASSTTPPLSNPPTSMTSAPESSPSSGTASASAPDPTGSMRSAPKTSPLNSMNTSPHPGSSNSMDFVPQSDSSGLTSASGRSSVSQVSEPNSVVVTSSSESDLEAVTSTSEPVTRSGASEPQQSTMRSTPGLESTSRDVLLSLSTLSVSDSMHKSDSSSAGDFTDVSSAQVKPSDGSTPSSSDQPADSVFDSSSGAGSVTESSTSFSVEITSTLSKYLSTYSQPYSDSSLKGMTTSWYTGLTSFEESYIPLESTFVNSVNSTSPPEMTTTTSLQESITTSGQTYTELSFSELAMTSVDSTSQLSLVVSESSTQISAGVTSTVVAGFSSYSTYMQHSTVDSFPHSGSDVISSTLQSDDVFSTPDSVLSTVTTVITPDSVSTMPSMFSSDSILPATTTFTTPDSVSAMPSMFSSVIASTGSLDLPLTGSTSSTGSSEFQSTRPFSMTVSLESSPDASVSDTSSFDEAVSVVPTYSSSPYPSSHDSVVMTGSDSSYFVNSDISPSQSASSDDSLFSWTGIVLASLSTDHSATSEQMSLAHSAHTDSIELASSTAALSNPSTLTLTSSSQSVTVTPSDQITSVSSAVTSADPSVSTSHLTTESQFLQSTQSSGVDSPASDRTKLPPIFPSSLSSVPFTADTSFMSPSVSTMHTPLSSQAITSEVSSSGETMSESNTEAVSPSFTAGYSSEPPHTPTASLAVSESLGTVLTPSFTVPLPTQTYFFSTETYTEGSDIAASGTLAMHDSVSFSSSFLSSSDTATVSESMSHINSYDSTSVGSFIVSSTEVAGESIYSTESNSDFTGVYPDSFTSRSHTIFSRPAISSMTSFSWIPSSSSESVIHSSKTLSLPVESFAPSTEPGSAYFSDLISEHTPFPSVEHGSSTSHSMPASMYTTTTSSATSTQGVHVTQTVVDTAGSVFVSGLSPTTDITPTGTLDASGFQTTNGIVSIDSVSSSEVSSTLYIPLTQSQPVSEVLSTTETYLTHSVNASDSTFSISVSEFSSTADIAPTSYISKDTPLVSEYVGSSYSDSSRDVSDTETISGSVDFSTTFVETSGGITSTSITADVSEFSKFSSSASSDLLLSGESLLWPSTDSMSLFLSGETILPSTETVSASSFGQTLLPSSDLSTFTSSDTPISLYTLTTLSELSTSMLSASGDSVTPTLIVSTGSVQELTSKIDIVSTESSNVSGLFSSTIFVSTESVNGSYTSSTLYISPTKTEPVPEMNSTADIYPTKTANASDFGSNIEAVTTQSMLSVNETELSSSSDTLTISMSADSGVDFTSTVSMMPFSSYSFVSGTFSTSDLVTMAVPSQTLTASTVLGSSFPETESYSVYASETVSSMYSMSESFQTSLLQPSFISSHFSSEYTLTPTSISSSELSLSLISPSSVDSTITMPTQSSDFDFATSTLFSAVSFSTTVPEFSQSQDIFSSYFSQSVFPTPTLPIQSLTSDVLLSSHTPPTVVVPSQSLTSDVLLSSHTPPTVIVPSQSLTSDVLLSSHTPPTVIVPSQSLTSDVLLSSHTPPTVVVPSQTLTSDVLLSSHTPPTVVVPSQSLTSDFKFSSELPSTFVSSYLSSTYSLVSPESQSAFTSFSQSLFISSVVPPSSIMSTPSSATYTDISSVPFSQISSEYPLFSTMEISSLLTSVSDMSTVLQTSTVSPENASVVTETVFSVSLFSSVDLSSSLTVSSVLLTESVPESTFTEFQTPPATSLPFETSLTPAPSSVAVSTTIETQTLSSLIIGSDSVFPSSSVISFVTSIPLPMPSSTLPSVSASVLPSSSDSVSFSSFSSSIVSVPSFSSDIVSSVVFTSSFASSDALTGSTSFESVFPTTPADSASDSVTLLPSSIQTSLISAPSSVDVSTFSDELLSGKSSLLLTSSGDVSETVMPSIVMSSSDIMTTVLPTSEAFATVISTSVLPSESNVVTEQSAFSSMTDSLFPSFTLQTSISVVDITTLPGTSSDIPGTPSIDVSFTTPSSAPSMTSILPSTAATVSSPLMTSSVESTSVEFSSSGTVVTSSGATSSSDVSSSSSSPSVMTSGASTLLVTQTSVVQPSSSDLVASSAMPTTSQTSPTTVSTTVEPTTSAVVTTPSAPPTTTTPVAEKFLVITVIRLEATDNITSPAFITDMEQRLAAAYDMAFKRQSAGGLSSSRKKRFAALLQALLVPGSNYGRHRRAVVNDVEVKMSGVTTEASNPSNAELTHSVTRAGQAVPATQAADTLNTLLDQELALELNRVVITKAKPVGQQTQTQVTPTDDGDQLWIIGAVLGPLALLVLVWVLICLLVRHREGKKDKLRIDGADIVTSNDHAEGGDSRSQPHLLTVKHGGSNETADETTHSDDSPGPSNGQPKGLLKSSPSKKKERVNINTSASVTTTDAEDNVRESKKGRKMSKKKGSPPPEDEEKTEEETSTEKIQKSTPSKKPKSRKLSIKPTEDMEMSPLDPGFFNTSMMQSTHQLYSQQTFEDEDEEFVENVEEERRKNKMRQRLRKKQNKNIATQPLSEDPTQAAYERAQQEIDKVLGPRQHHTATSASDVAAGKKDRRRSRQRSKKGQTNEGLSSDSEHPATVSGLPPSESLDEMKSRVHALLDDAFSLLSNSRSSLGIDSSAGSKFHRSSRTRNRVAPGTPTKSTTAPEVESTPPVEKSAEQGVMPEVEEIRGLSNAPKPGEKLHTPLHVERTHDYYDADGLITWSPYRASDESAHIVLPESQPTDAKVPVQEKLHTTTFNELSAGGIKAEGYYATQPGQPIVIRTQKSNDSAQPKVSKPQENKESGVETGAQQLDGTGNTVTEYTSYPGLEAYQQLLSETTTTAHYTASSTSQRRGSTGAPVLHRQTSNNKEEHRTSQEHRASRPAGIMSVLDKPPSQTNREDGGHRDTSADLPPKHRPPSRNVGNMDERDVIASSMQNGDSSTKNLVDSIRQELQSLSSKMLTDISTGSSKAPASKVTNGLGSNGDIKRQLVKTASEESKEHGAAGSKDTNESAGMAVKDTNESAGMAGKDTAEINGIAGRQRKPMKKPRRAFDCN